MGGFNIGGGKKSLFSTLLHKTRDAGSTQSTPEGSTSSMTNRFSKYFNGWLLNVTNMYSSSINEALNVDGEFVLGGPATNNYFIQQQYSSVNLLTKVDSYCTFYTATTGSYWGIIGLTGDDFDTAVPWSAGIFTVATHTCSNLVKSVSGEGIINSIAGAGDADGGVKLVVDGVTIIAGRKLTLFMGLNIPFHTGFEMYVSDTAPDTYGVQYTLND